MRSNDKYIVAHTFDENGMLDGFVLYKRNPNNSHGDAIGWSSVFNMCDICITPDIYYNSTEYLDIVEFIGMFEGFDCF